jgi:hypothetical protein
VKITAIIAIGTAAAALMAIPAAAQTAPAPAPADTAQQGERMRRQPVEQTRAQAEQRAARMFARLDVDGNGTIDAADRAALQQQGDGQGRNGRLRRFVDIDGDAAITQADFTARAMAMFDQLDTDRNGVLSVEEQRAGRAQRRAGAGGPPSTIR